MEQQTSRIKLMFLAIVSLAAWFALGLQFNILIIVSLAKGATLISAIGKFFSYFTILTNILVALTFTVLWFKPAFAWGKFFSRPTVLTAVTVYISFVGISYSLLLRHIWDPQGWHLLADELLHTIIPALVVLYWLLFVPKTGLQWKNTPYWLLYPLVYVPYVLVRGELTGSYPYHFVDISDLGYSQALLNGVTLIFAFFLLSLLFVAIAKAMNRTSH